MSSRPDSRSLAIDALMIVAGGGGILALSSVSAMDSTFLQFLLALVIINLLDVVLPHGDSVDIDSALLVAALYLLGPAMALIAALSSRAIAHLLSGGHRNLYALASGLAKRVAGLLAATPIWLGISSGAAPGSIREYLALLLAGAAYVITQLVYGQIGLALLRSDSLIRLTASNLVLQGPLLASGVSVAILTVIVYDGMTVWGLALMGFLLLAMRQSFALLLDVRGAYHATIEALIGAMEAQRPGEQGTGERVAVLARRNGAEYGWFGARVESLGYAALLHYFGLGFRQSDSGDGEGRPTPLSEVKFFRPVEPVVLLLSGHTVESPGADDVTAAYIVALSLCAVDANMGAHAVKLVRPRIDGRTAAKVERAVHRAERKAKQA